MAGARRTRGSKKSGLTRRRIVVAALALVEDGGLAAFSMRRLGQALGVEAMSLYHHFPGKAHVLDAVLDHVMAMHATPDPALPFQERVRQLAIGYRALMLKYPEFAGFAIVHRMNTPGGLAWLERTTRVFLDAGFDDETAARNFRAFGYYLMGAVLDETAGYARGPGAAEPLTEQAQYAVAPSLERLAPYFKGSQWEATFLRGLELLIDGMCASLTAPPATPRGPAAAAGPLPSRRGCR